LGTIGYDWGRLATIGYDWGRLGTIGDDWGRLATIGDDKSDCIHNTIRTISKKFLSFRSFSIFWSTKKGNQNHARARRRKLRCVALRQEFKRMFCYVNYTDSHVQM